MNQKDKFVRKMHSELDQLNNEIDSFIARVDKAEEHIQNDFYDHIEELHNKRDEIHQKLYELEQASENAWEDMKLGIEMAVSDISEAIKLAISRFK